MSHDPYSRVNFEIYYSSTVRNFLAQKSPDIQRNKFGGGVAILVKEGIEFIQDFSFDEFPPEILSIKLNYGKNDQFYVFSLPNEM
ncbi:hypothetical protein BpHYR1_021292 [Brachionus plicatilis]|uniref:Uncharacterized protein n=1 Tax=Brachionus plicatilis TaxID=10195 RepID=A0A3M7PHG9_BRAPC|nr:hypothetical protein BpHYR1_021292 [Brachionus plicatilis]